MGNFLYKARDRQGLLQSGHLDAGDQNDALNILQQRGLIVVSVSNAEQAKDLGTQPAARRRLHGRANNDDKILFCQQLAILLEAGIPLLRSLSVVSAQTESRAMLVAMEEMKRDIEGGWTFRHAIAKHPKIFSPFWINLVETGEASGHLAKSLNQLSHYLESARELQSKAVTAMTYPLILVGGSVFAIGIFVLKIIPVFSGIFKSMNMEIPPLTKAVILLSDMATKYFILFAAAIAAIGYLTVQFVRTEKGRWMVDNLVLKIPIFNRMLVAIQLAQFSRGLGTLLDSGVPILACLEIMERSSTNVVYAQANGRTKEHVREGRTMAEPLERTGLFPPMMVQMIQVGEEIGELSKMLDKVAK